MQTLYDAAGGAEGMLRLAHAWHERVLADEIVAHAFSHGFEPDHTERLAVYWGEALGGPPDYTTHFGDESHVVRIHSGNGEHDEMDDRAVDCFDAALVDSGITDARVAGPLHDYFAWATRTWLHGYEHDAGAVPPGLALPKWSWNGLVRDTGQSLPPELA